MHAAGKISNSLHFIPSMFVETTDMAFQVSVPPSVSAKMAKTIEDAEENEEGERTNKREDYKKVFV